jgi:hypothetical protein
VVIAYTFLLNQGRVRALVRHAGLRSFLLTEMVARMAKQILRQRFRVYLKPKETFSAQVSLSSIS